MQQNLASQYECAWAVADLVSTHGVHDFRSDDQGITRVISLCGLKIYIENHLPVRFVASDLDLVLIRYARAQPFASVLSGAGLRTVHEIIGSDYALRFDRGDLGVLQHWLDELNQFIGATAIRRAA